jgi:hypothetical protein
LKAEQRDEQHRPAAEETRRRPHQPERGRQQQTRADEAEQDGGACRGDKG